MQPRLHRDSEHDDARKPIILFLRLVPRGHRSLRPLLLKETCICPRKSRYSHVSCRRVNKVRPLPQCFVGGGYVDSNRRETPPSE